MSTAECLPSPFELQMIATMDMDVTNRASSLADGFCAKSCEGLDSGARGCGVSIERQNEAFSPFHNGGYVVGSEVTREK